MKALAIILAANLCILFYGGLLYLAGPLVLLATAIACFVGCIAYLCRLDRQPLTDTDLALARADEELDRAERAARARRAAQAGARSLQSGGGFRG